MSNPPSYKVQLLDDIDQLRQCLEIQRLAWGFSDADILPIRSLIICSKIGGQVFGAVDDGGQVLGFLNAFPGYRDGKVYLHSNMLGVRPECQNHGIGRQLKLAQREEALSRGIELVEWTFDPLEVRNARINLELLGAICRTYLPNFYGASSSHLHGGLPTDRLVAEWHLNSARVKSRLGSSHRQRRRRRGHGIAGNTPQHPGAEIWPQPEDCGRNSVRPSRADDGTLRAQFLCFTIGHRCCKPEGHLPFRILRTNESCLMILSGRWVVPVSSPPLDHGAIAIEGSRILEVGSLETICRNYPGHALKSFPQAALLPGLVNVHSHLELTVLRGYLEGLDFWQLDSHFDANEV